MDYCGAFGESAGTSKKVNFLTNLMITDATVTMFWACPSHSVIRVSRRLDRSGMYVGF